jgi:hypothetical protein
MEPVGAMNLCHSGFDAEPVIGPAKRPDPLASPRNDEERHFGHAPKSEFIEPDQRDSTCPVLSKKINPFALPPNQI